ncbi:hypothetical protein [Altererythrobacter epoxidivorans]|uniref:hypothetical protein n=1 Tax=Altererythrobacter epoxidivorans TaxID=361183 RepID=UPI0012EDC0AB|nr:hypothetical protein [Altererythrobacter epoxidivorans]
MLEFANAPGNVRSLRQFGEAVVIVCGTVGTHEGTLVLGILVVEVHVSSPAVAGC